MPNDGVRQRKSHHKTRAGARHVKCDEGKPECQNCRSRQLQCGGYEKRKVKIFDGLLAPAPPSTDDQASPLEIDNAPADTNAERRPLTHTLPYRTSPRQSVGRVTCEKRRIRCDETKPNCNRCVKAKLLWECYNSSTTTAHSSPGTFVDPSLILPSSEADNDFLAESTCSWHPFLHQIETYCAGPSLNSAFSASFSAFSPASDLHSWMPSADISIPDLDHFHPPFPLSVLHANYASLRHIYAATALHYLALEIPTLTLSTLTEIQILALDHETCAIQVLRTETPPLAVTALTAFLFFWVEVWQRGWDAAIPHLRYAQSTMRRRSTMRGTPDVCTATREVADFVEAFCRGIPSVLQGAATLEAMPETDIGDADPAATAAPAPATTTTTTTLDPLHDLSLSSAMPIKPSTPDTTASAATAGRKNARFAYATFHAQRAIAWAAGAAEEALLLTKQRLGGDTQPRYVRGLLTVLGAELRALLDRWGALVGMAASPLELPDSSPLVLSALESPFAAAMKHLGLFLGRKAGFEMALFEAQVKLSAGSVLLFAADAEAGLRMDAVGVLRRGNEVRRRLAGETATGTGVDLGLELAAAAASGTATAGFGVGVLDAQLGLEMQVVDVASEGRAAGELDGAL